MSSTATAADPDYYPTGEVAGVPAVRRGAVWWSSVALIGLLLVASAASLAIGAKGIAPGIVIDALLDPDPASSVHAVVQARIPRTVLGLLVGAGLALAGAAMQSLTRNPLADPGILGINAGAAFAVVLGIATVGLSTATEYAWWALGGAATAFVLVYAVASAGRVRATPLKLVLAGTALNAGFVSVVTLLLVLDQQRLERYRFWSVGSVVARDWTSIDAVWPLLLAGLVAILLAGRPLNALALGDDLARGLGQNVLRTRLVVAAGVTLLCGAATAAAGPIAFVGLMIPHAVRSLVGPDNRVVLPLSALAGACLLVIADTIGRVIAPPGEVQVAVMTAVIGVPVFIWLVTRRRTAQR